MVLRVDMITKSCLVLVLLGVHLAVSDDSVQQQWTNFKTTHQKSYTSPAEEANRFQIFQDNLKRINEHNEKYARGESTYTLGINQFADLSSEEFKSSGYVGGLKFGKTRSGRPKLGASLGSRVSSAPSPLLGKQNSPNNVQLGARFGGNLNQPTQWQPYSNAAPAAAAQSTASNSGYNTQLQSRFAGASLQPQFTQWGTYSNGASNFNG